LLRGGGRTGQHQETGGKARDGAAGPAACKASMLSVSHHLTVSEIRI
jgi:hypothetical protein